MLSSSPSGATRPSYIRPRRFDPPHAEPSVWCSWGASPRLCRPNRLYAQRIPRATDRFAERIPVPSTGAARPGYIEPTNREPAAAWERARVGAKKPPRDSGEAFDLSVALQLRRWRRRMPAAVHARIASAVQPPCSGTLDGLAGEPATASVKSPVAGVFGSEFPKSNRNV